MTQGNSKLPMPLSEKQRASLKTLLEHVEYMQGDDLCRDYTDNILIDLATEAEDYVDALKAALELT